MQRGVVAIEAALGAVLFLFVIGVIIDYGFLLHRRSLLFDATLKAVQEVSRDPAAAVTFDGLVNRGLELFRSNADRLAANRSSELVLTEISYSCASGAVTLVSQWPTTCVFCFDNHFQKVLNAKAAAMIESPVGQLGDKTCEFIAGPPW